MGRFFANPHESDEQAELTAFANGTRALEFQARVHVDPPGAQSLFHAVRFDEIRPRPDWFLGQISVVVSCHPFCSSRALDLACSKLSGSGDGSMVLAPPPSQIPRQCSQQLPAKISKLANERNRKRKVQSQGCGSALSQIKSIPWCIPAGKVISDEPFSLSAVWEEEGEGGKQSLVQTNTWLHVIEYPRLFRCGSKIARSCWPAGLIALIADYSVFAFV